jgi:copper(I)-binding protein
MKTMWLAMALAVGAQAHACGELKVSDSWARLAPPTAPVMAGYLTLGNASDESVVIGSASSPDFERVELHNMTHEGGVMQMRKLDRIEVKAGDKVELAPGGMHLMLIGPKRVFVAGDGIEVTLRLCGETDQVVNFVVREAAPEGGSAHAEHQHHH